MELRLFRSIQGIKDSILHNMGGSPPLSQSTHTLIDILDDKTASFKEPMNPANPFISTQVPQDNSHAIKAESTFSESETDTELKYRAFFIYSTYLDPASPFHVKVPQHFLLDARARLRIETLDTLEAEDEDQSAIAEGPTVGMFDKLLAFVESKLEDYYSIFKKSPEYSDLLKEIEMREVTQHILLKLQMTPGLS